MKKESSLFLRMGFFFSVGGFFIALLLSLLGGNSLITSALRGFIGLLMFFIVGILFAFILYGTIRNINVAGTQIDYSLPPEVPDQIQERQSDRDQTDTFVPMSFPQTKTQIDDEQARKLAEALRQWND